MVDTIREEFSKWCNTVPTGAELDNLDMLPSDALEAAWVGYQAATSASDARYQARVRELEDALQSALDNAVETKSGELQTKLLKLLSTASPDTALQKAVLEAEIRLMEWAYSQTNFAMFYQRAEDLRAQLAALGDCDEMWDEFQELKRKRGMQ